MKQVLLNRWLIYAIAVILIVVSLLLMAKGYFFIALAFFGAFIVIGIWDSLSDDD